MTQITPLIALIKGNARLAAFIVVIVALVIATFVFYSGSHSSAAQQAKVEKQLAAAQNNLKIAQDTYDVSKLQLEQASLPDYRSSFPDSFPSNDLNNYISAGASNYSINVKSLTPRGSVGTQTVGGTRYVEYDTVVQIAPLVSGDYNSMDLFLSYLENGPFFSLSIQGASFTADGGTFTVVILAKS
jgi:FlaG/FlaF family flagellin (archaellin)